MIRTALICHADNPLSREVLPAWLASFSDLALVVVISEHGGYARKRVRWEWRRSRLRLFDVFAFRLYYRLRLQGRDNAWLESERKALRDAYGDAPSGVTVHHTSDPNSEATRAALVQAGPDLVLARCKMLLAPEIFNVPRHGTVILHPGICPEYRNAHGCFWALARRDHDHVGATMLRIDEGVDTGPVLGYYGATFDERAHSHIVIQHKVVFDNLDRIAADLSAYCAADLQPIDTSGRSSRAWGQPRLTDWIRWKRAARRDARANAKVVA